jgi:ApbE superfamily uncharacterized protein (UPF0280 family)
VSGGAFGARSADGRRLHLQHGPIDLVIEADGPPEAVEAAHVGAAARFATILDELVGELEVLRRPVGPDAAVEGLVGGAVAGRMVRAVAAVAAALPEERVTAMAAVAGAVAEEVLAAMVAAAPLDRAFVNDGGDIAIHLAPGTELALGMVGDLARREVVGSLVVRADGPVRGVATSGAGGRSLTLGIADAVTVLASGAALADVVATVIANAVDLPGHPAVVRRPAIELDASSDLGERAVTVRVGPLSAGEVADALARGAERAGRLERAGLLAGAVLSLDGQRAAVGRAAPRLEAGGGGLAGERRAARAAGADLADPQVGPGRDG